MLSQYLPIDCIDLLTPPHPDNDNHSAITPITTPLTYSQTNEAVMENQSSPSNGRPDRALRITTIVTFVPALALLIPSGVVTARPLPAIGLVPMAMSLVVSMAALTSNKSSVRMRPTADTIVALSLMTVMVFRFVRTLSRRGRGVFCPSVERETDSIDLSL